MTLHPVNKRASEMHENSHLGGTNYGKSERDNGNDLPSADRFSLHSDEPLDEYLQFKEPNDGKVG